MKIVVTGGAGFIGSALIRYLIKETNDEVVNLDKLTYAGNGVALKNEAISDRYWFERGDICDFEFVSDVLKRHRPDAIMHLAAESHVDNSIKGPREFVITNVVGTFELLEAVRAYWTTLDGDSARRFRFLHISTDEVFGDLALDEPRFCERTPYAPTGCALQTHTVCLGLGESPQSQPVLLRDATPCSVCLQQLRLSVCPTFVRLRSH